MAGVMATLITASEPHDVVVGDDDDDAREACVCRRPQMHLGVSVVGVVVVVWPAVIIIIIGGSSGRSPSSSPLAH